MLKKNRVYKYTPRTKEELRNSINKELEIQGNEADLNCIDTSKITDISSVFYDYKDFNGDLSHWDVSNVTDVTSTFFNCRKFEGKGIETWNLRPLESLYYTFKCCENFNADLSKWDVSEILNMSNTFYNCRKFEGKGLEKWDMSKVINLDSTFRRCDIFNGISIENWKLDSIEIMKGTFRECNEININVSEWNTSNLKDISFIFCDCPNFEGKGIYNWKFTKEQIESMKVLHSFNNCNIILISKLLNINLHGSISHLLMYNLIKE